MRDLSANRQTFPIPSSPGVQASDERGRYLYLPPPSPIPVHLFRGIPPMVEVPLKQRPRVSDEAIVMGIRLIVAITFLAVLPGLVWLLSL
jgi:hypothetical protein